MSIPVTDNEFQPADERRKFPRRLLRVTAKVNLGVGRVFEVRTFDISTEGLGIVASSDPKKGTTFKIEVTIPARPTGMQLIEATTTVVHSILSREENGFKIGLLFVDLDPDLKAAIRRYVGG